MTNIWLWLEGKKTYIGAAIVGISAALLQLGVIDQKTAADLTQIGVSIATVGLAYKFQKFIDK